MKFDELHKNIIDEAAPKFKRGNKGDALSFKIAEAMSALGLVEKELTISITSDRVKQAKKDIEKVKKALQNITSYTLYTKSDI